MSTQHPRSRGEVAPAAPPSHLAVVCLALIFFIASWNTGERPLVLIAVPVLLWVFVRHLRRPISQPNATPIIIAAIVILGYDMLVPRAIGQGQPEGHMVNEYARLMNMLWIVFAGAMLYRIRKDLDVGWKWRTAVVLLTAVLSTGLIAATPEPGIDVWHLHQQAGRALFDGDNPFADVRVFFSSDDVDAESRIMTGYPYTPPNLFVFGSSAALTGDSRWFSLACWLGFLGLFAALRPRSAVGTALLLFLASQPAWHVVLEIAYTETVTLLLLIGAVVAWRHRRFVGPVLLGLALASKQYLVVLAPMVLGARLLTLKTRLVSLGAAALAAGIGLLWGAGDYIDAVVGLHLRVPPQPHSVNLFGISYFFGAPVLLPAIVGIIASVILGLISARTARQRSQLLIGAAAALGLGFFLASQAFVNYWFLVGCVLALALLLAEPSDQKRPLNPEGTRAAHAT